MKKLILFLFVVFFAAQAYAIEVSNVKLGGQVRVRGYNLQNFWDFDNDVDSDNWSVIRHKTSVHAGLDLGDGISGFVKITNQNWGNGVTPSDNNDLFVDNAWINVKNFLDLPVTLKLGRQNLMYGSGFVLFDGQSQLGSNSLYFDGIKLTAHFSDNMMLDMIYVKDEENARANNAAVGEDDITLSGLYLTYKETPIVGKAEVYALNRHDESLGKDIIMYGLRASDKLKCGFDYSAEIAVQTGDAMTNVDQDAMGYKLDAGYTLKDVSMKPRFFVGYAALTGDEAGSTDNERWDTFYGGWPQFGDLLAFKYINAGPFNILNTTDPGYNSMSSVGGEAVYSNINILTVGTSAALTEKLSGKVSYSTITFDEIVGDDEFGNYVQGSVKYKYSKNLSFSIYAAMIDPGDAFGTMEDKATEFMWEADLRF